MRALAVAMISLVLGCAHRAAAPPAVDPTGTPEEPAASCIVRRSRPVDPVPSYVWPVAEEYRYDGRGRLLYAVDQTKYASVRRSWFSYDAHDRVVHVRRRLDRAVFPSATFPSCDEPPCPPPPYNDQDGIDEDYRYDDQNRLVWLAERHINYDHQGGTWRDAPADPRRGTMRSESSPGSICDLDPVVCRARVRVGGSFRPFRVSSRTVERRYRSATDELPASERVSVMEKSNVDESAASREPRLEEHTTDYSYDVEPRSVMRYRVVDGKRIPDRRVERDSAGRVLSETDFSSDGVIWRQASHTYDDAGRRAETIWTDHDSGSRSTIRSVETYAYDQRDRLTSVRWTYASDGSTRTWTYEHDGGCGIVRWVPEDPRGKDPLERLLGSGSP